MGIHAIEKRQLSAKGMLEKIRSAFEKIPEPPRSTRGLKSNISAADCLIDLLHNQGSVDFSVLLSRFLSQIRGVISTTSILPHEFDSKIGQNNPKTRRTLGYARGLMSGLAVFGLKFPSLLQFDSGLDDPVIKHNLQTLYKVKEAPCDTYMREKLDQVDPRSLRPAFTSIFSLLQRGKILEDYRFLDKYLLVPCDGTGLFSSNAIHCENCCEKHHKDGEITYYHQKDFSFITVCHLMIQITTYRLILLIVSSKIKKVKQHTFLGSQTLS